MNVEKFIEFDFIKKNFQPYTPYGKNYKENFSFLVDKNKLNRRYDAIEYLDELRKKKRIVYDKIRYHLRNIPFITPSRGISDISDVFIVKKFINNYFAIYHYLPTKIRNHFGFKYELSDLHSLLNPDGVSDTFYISEKYDKRITDVKKELESIIGEIESYKKMYLSRIQKEVGFDIKGDFAVVELSKLSNKIYEFFTVDVYDSKKAIIRVKYPSEYIDLSKKRQEIVSKLKKIESEVINSIMEKLKKQWDNIVSCIEPIFELDIAFASCELKEKFNLKRPSFNNSRIYIRNGIFLPLKSLLDDMNAKYFPLTFSFDKRINIIQGSNMGGKTVVLKTVAFLQYLAQIGLFVPADEFNTIIFDKISVIIPDEEVRGLSSFAYEVNEISEEIKSISQKKVLIISDEFGRTTNVNEGLALVNSLIEYFSKRENIYFFLATHLSGIQKFDDIDFLRMKGFNKKNYLKYNIDDLKDIKQRIKLINRFMDYEIVRTSNSLVLTSDAIEIAHLIGINNEIYNKAKEYLEVQDANKSEKQTENTNIRA